jgi:hypothetical protein
MHRLDEPMRILGPARTTGFVPPRVVNKLGESELMYCCGGGASIPR